MTVKERLVAYIKFKGLSARQFSISIGVSAGYVAAISQSIQPDKLSRISTQYPDLNTEWLLTGEGEMLKLPTQSAGNPQSLPLDVSGDRFDRLMNVLEMQAKQMQIQSEQIQTQDERIKKQAEQIDKLIEKNNRLIERLEKQESEEGLRPHKALAHT